VLPLSLVDNSVPGLLASMAGQDNARSYKWSRSWGASCHRSGLRDQSRHPLPQRQVDPFDMGSISVPLSPNAVRANWRVIRLPQCLSNLCLVSGAFSAARRCAAARLVAELRGADRRTAGPPRRPGILWRAEPGVLPNAHRQSGHPHALLVMPHDRPTALPTSKPVERWHS
jgi:hypothetical protein